MTDSEQISLIKDLSIIIAGIVAVSTFLSGVAEFVRQGRQRRAENLVSFFAVTSPDVYAKFYRDPFGMRMILFALTLQLVGVFAIRRIVQIEY